MHLFFKGFVTAAFLLAYATVTAEAQVNVLAPVLKSNSKGVFKPFKAKGNAEFDVTVRLYEDSAGLISIEDDARQPWEEELSFSVRGKTELPASNPVAGSYSLYVPVDGFLDLNIGVKTPLPSDLGAGFVYFTTAVTPYKKGAANDPYDESPTKLLFLGNAPEQILHYMSLLELDDGQGGTATTLRIEGANLQIVNGTGSTAGAVDGLGNLIVGYNETGNPDGDDRTGSHNIVTGRRNSFSSYGGLVAGVVNTVSGQWSSVSGGLRNTASGNISSVSGGYYNTASGEYASVSGGMYAVASGYASSVSAGYDCLASGSYSSVTGGSNNEASGFGSSVSGGYSNEASEFGSSVSGGSRGEAGGTGASVNGGFGNEASGYASSVSGGYNNVASGYESVVSAGSNNTASGTTSSVSGGYYNTAFASYSSVSGGKSNTASGQYSSVSGGTNNTANAVNASVSGGYGNTASGDSSSVSGGLTNAASGFNSSVSGGHNNSASSFQSSVSGGAARSAPATSDWAAGALFEDN